MDTLRIKERKPVDEHVENWDDDDFLIEGDDLALRNPSISACLPPHRRDSLSSHKSLRSERDSVHGEEDQQVHLPNHDEISALNAIAIAASAGIPIPRSVPPSALQGTIKRLGGRKVKEKLPQDWSDDLMFPEGSGGLRIKSQDPARFPAVLRQVSSTLSSPPKPTELSSGPDRAEPTTTTTTPAMVLGPPINLERYRDTENDDDLFGDGSDTIKVSKTRRVSKPVLSKIALITPPPRKDGDDDFEKDLELPSDGTLKLTSRRDVPRTPLSGNDDFDWGEGSLGTRYGGTRRDGRSNRSSSTSAFSPSIASSITAESEDEAQLDGLELPHGPLDLRDRLKRQRQNRSPERIIEEEPTLSKVVSGDTEEADFFTGLDVGDGSVFGSGRLKLHTNVKLKDTRSTSPLRPKAAVSLTFTNKPVQNTSRLPRPALTHHERTLTQSSLEPVSESGGPIASRPTRRSQSRLGHMSQSSQSSTGSNTTPIISSGPPNFQGPSTPRRREVGQKTSSVSLRAEPTTTNAQLLRLKRSLPAMSPGNSPGRPLAARPSSRTDTSARPSSALRPKTPVEKIRQSTGEGSVAQARKPFLPAGSSISQSSNVNARRSLRRHGSDMSVELRPTSRTASRTAVRSPSPTKQRDRNLEKLARAGARQPLSLPKRPRQFGDGHELDAFDDLPTSAKTELEFVKQPKFNNQQYPTQFRNKVMQHLLPGRTSSPAPSTPHSALHSSARFDYQPHFARDTASSRIARETNLAHRVPSSGPLAPLTSQRVAQLSTRSNLHPLLPPQGTIRSKKHPRKPPQLKPHLIANLNSNKESKSK